MYCDIQFSVDVSTTKIPDNDFEVYRHMHARTRAILHMLYSLKRIIDLNILNVVYFIVDKEIN